MKTAREVQGYARRMRKNATPAEAVLRVELMFHFGPHNLKNQCILGFYIADFVIASKMLVIEVDGATHDSLQAQAYDIKRTAFLQAAGFKVIRYTNQEVRSSAKSVAEEILKYPESGGGRTQFLSALAKANSLKGAAMRIIP